MGTDGSAVPRFSSFRPKLESQSSRRDPSPVSESSRDRRDRRDCREKRKWRLGGDAASGSRQSSSACQRSRRTKESSKGDDSDLFVIDRVGDVQNIQYGIFDQYKIPQYRRAGAGCVLGLGRASRIDFGASDAQTTVLGRRAGAGDDADGLGLSAGGVSRPRRHVRPVVGRTIQPEMDYVAVQAHGGAALDPKADNRDGRNGGDDGDDGGDAETNERRERIKLRTRLLSARTDRDPADVAAWLALADHQDAIVAMDRPFDRPDRTADSRAAAEMKMAVIEAGLDRVPADHPNRYRLALRLVRLAELTGDYTATAKRWDGFLTEFADCFAFRLEHLNYLQTNVFRFTFDATLAAFASVFLCLDGPASQSRDVERVYLFVRLTRFVYESGYHELGTALWQAVLEFHFFAPPSPSLAGFEDFWDDDLPRIGQAGAAGWSSHRTANPGQTMAPLADTDADRILDPARSADPLGFFARHERVRMLKSVLSGPIDDPAADQDPFRVVMFSEIKPFLAAMSAPSVRPMLVAAFLCFCGLPPLCDAGSAAVLSFWTDPFLARPPFYDTVSNLRGAQMREGSFADLVRRLTDFPLGFRLDPGHVVPRPLTKLRRRPFETWALVTLVTLSKSAHGSAELQEYTAIRIGQSVSVSASIKFAKSLLKRDPSNVRLYAIIAVQNGSVGASGEANRILSAALSLCSLDSTPAAIMVWRKYVWDALQSGDSKSAISRLFSIGSPAQSAFFGPADPYLVEFPTVELVRVRNSLSVGFQNANAAGSIDIAAAFAECSMLLDCLESSRSNRSSPFDQLHKSVVGLQNSIPSTLSPAQARLLSILLCNSHSRIIKQHILTHPVLNSASLRAHLETTLESGPYDIDLFLLYIANESRSRTDHRVSNLFNRLSQSQISKTGFDLVSPTGHLTRFLAPVMQVWAEIQRSTLAGQTENSIRAAFERAVSISRSDTQLPSGSSETTVEQADLTADHLVDMPVYSASPSYALWKSYIYFELHQVMNKKVFNIAFSRPEDTQETSKQAERAKNVYMRAVRAMPWSKQILMKGFTHAVLHSVLTHDDKTRMWNMLNEKELRVSVDIEDQLKITPAAPDSDR